MNFATYYRKLEAENQRLREALAKESEATRKVTEEAAKRVEDGEAARKLAERAAKRAEELDAELAKIRGNLATEAKRREAEKKRAAEGEGRLHTAVSSLLSKFWLELLLECGYAFLLLASERLLLLLLLRRVRQHPLG